QPRVAVSLPGTNRSRYARMYGSDSGIDPYTRAVSDIYQDLFLEGSFIGKGIYEVDVFEQALAGRFPENRILSHDLIEGCYARSGLLSDAMVYEEYPTRYSADVSRRHRWIRGDWQLVRWLFPVTPGPGPSPDQRSQKNPLSALSRWKLFDNLRRSLAPSALTLLLLLGWTVTSSPWFWSLSVLGIIFIPSLISSLLDLLGKPEDVHFVQHVAAVGRSTARRLIQDAFTLACLPYEAFFSLDAIIRTTWRMLVTHKRLLEWSPSADPDKSTRNSSLGGLAGVCRTMWFAPCLAVAAIIYPALFNPAVLAAAAPILLLWVASPIMAWGISRPIARDEARLKPDQTLFLRKLSRKTWTFFETFVGPEENWLPPDNYQDNAAPTVAHRTSPTNMGLALLANLSAHDFGYISTRQLIERTTNAFSTMGRLERYRGHFYNWYDTQSLKPLSPKYVSTVDSGNLAAHLLTLRQGLLALPDQKILGPQVFDGLLDTLWVLLDVAAEERYEGDVAALLTQLQKELESVCKVRPTALTAVRLHLDQLSRYAEEVLSRIYSLGRGQDDQTCLWARAFAGQC